MPSFSTQPVTPPNGPHAAIHAHPGVNAQIRGGEVQGNMLTVHGRGVGGEFDFDRMDAPALRILLEETLEHNAALQQRLQRREADVDVLYHHNKHCESRIAQLQEECQRLRTRLGPLGSVLAPEEELARLRAQVNEATTTIATLQERCSSQEARDAAEVAQLKAQMARQSEGIQKVMLTSLHSARIAPNTVGGISSPITDNVSGTPSCGFPVDGLALTVRLTEENEALMAQLKEAHNEMRELRNVMPGSSAASECVGVSAIVNTSDVMTSANPTEATQEEVEVKVMEGRVFVRCNGHNISMHDYLKSSSTSTPSTPW